MTDQAETLRILRPAPNILGFYDGRAAGKRLHGPHPNWLDDGGFSLGTCSYAIVDQGQALVYDTHMTLDHALRIRAILKDEGVRETRVVLSHHHLDHIAGNAAFSDCEILANAATAAAMAENREAAETADPPVNPVVMPTTLVEDQTELRVGSVQVSLRSFDIHSYDGLVLFLPGNGILLAGDTLEDTVTYVAEPDRLHIHLKDLDRMETLAVERIFPNHGAEAVIAQGGYDRRLIGATSRYVRKLLACRDNSGLAGQCLREFVAEDTAAGALIYEPAYEVVHQRNVAAVLAV